MKLVSGPALRTLAPMREIVEAVRAGFLAAARGEIRQAPRTTLEATKTLGYFCEAVDGSGTSVKVATVKAENRASGLPTMQGVVLWIDATGRPVALFEAETLTSMRTGAVVGAATDVLAAPDAATLALIGTGGQAADQVRAVLAVRAIRRVNAFSPTPAKREAFCAALAAEVPNVEFCAVSRVEEALAGADVVCCATSSLTPPFDLSALPERVHVNSIGSFPRTVKELSPQLLASADVVAVDLAAWAAHETGDIGGAVEAGVIREQDLVELAQLFADPAAYAGRRRTVFKSTGLPLQDFATARLLVDRALARADLPSFAPFG